MKKLIAIALILSMALSLCACAATENNVVGIWEREVVYLEHYGCDTVMYVMFDNDGNYYEILLDADSNMPLNFEYGDWEIDGLKLAAQEKGEAGTTYYSYTFGKLKNGDLKYTKLDEDSDVYEIFDTLFDI